jgi:hypothetical protein
MSKKILLMYLGGETNTPNLLKHWEIMNETFINKNNYYVVIHPKVLENYKINNVFLKIFNPSNIFIVDEEHHLLTGWATRSLTDATLMMMQYAHIQNNNDFFDKYILLSSSCIPLYNLDEIYNVLFTDDKSWLFGIFEHTYSKKFTHSQWIILDKKHAIYFFDNNKGKFIKTYIKNVQINNCTTFNGNKVTTQNIKIINPINDYNLHNHFRMYYECKLSDEDYFGTYIFKYNNIDTSNMLDGLYRDFIYKNIRIITEYDKSFKLKNIPITIKSYLLDITKNINKNIYYVKPIKTTRNNTYKSDKDLYNDVIISTWGGIIGDYESCSSTFFNFPDLSIAPINVIRDFSLFKLDLDKFINLENLPSDTFNFLNSNITKIDNLELNQNIEKCSDKFYNTLHGITTSISNHPIEYSCWTLQNMLNVYIFLIFFRCYAKNKNYSLEHWADKARENYASDICFKLYQKIIFKEFLISEDYNIFYDFDFYKCLIEDFDYKIKEFKINLLKKFGTFITNSTLLSGYMNGSLFIRKCYDTSLIEEYSHILKNCQYDYSPDSDPIKEVITGNYDISTHNKYLKYKKKYLQLKNTSKEK